MSNSLVSVLVPVYQAEAYIERCARSLFEQTYDNLEYLFCDDCSPDASIRKLESVMKDYPARLEQIRILHHEQNRGSAATRNTLIANCKGVFLFWVDADDWVDINSIELLVKKQRENDADIVTCRAYAHYDDTVKEHFDGGCNLDRDHLLEMILKGKCGSSVWRRLIRRSLHTDHDIKCLEGVNGRDDFQLIIPLIYYSRKVDSIDAFLYHYYKSPHQSITYELKKKLTYQTQSLASYQVLLSFLTGKDEHYAHLCGRMMVKRAHVYMLYQYQFGNRKGYKTIVDFILDTDKHYWKEIRWENTFIRWLECNYEIMRLTYPLRKLFNKFLH